MRPQGSGKPPEFEFVEQEVAGIIEDLELYSYYQLLELRQDATAAVVDYNYNLKVRELQMLQKNIHCGAATIQNINILLERMEEAYQVVSDAKRRHEYDVGLLMGQMRHPVVVQQRALPMPRKVQRDQYLEQVTEGLERKIPKEYLESDQQVGDEYRPIDGEFLDEALSHLSAKLEQDKLNIHDAGEEDDVPADADFVGVVIEDLEAELGELGMDRSQLGLRSDEERQEADELKRLAEEVRQAGEQTAQLAPGVTPLLQSLSRPPADRAAVPPVQPLIAARPPGAAPGPRGAAPVGGPARIDLDDDGSRDALPLRDEEGERPFDDVIQLDDEDL